MDAVAGPVRPDGPAGLADPVLPPLDEVRPVGGRPRPGHPEGDVARLPLAPAARGQVVDATHGRGEGAAAERVALSGN